MFEKKNIKKELKSLEETLEKETDWNDYEKINKKLKKKNYLSNFIQSLNNLENMLDPRGSKENHKRITENLRNA